MTETTGSASPRRTSRTEKESAPAPVEVQSPFQPQQYLENRDGLPYLPLKWRLAWLRSEHPHAKIATKLVNLNDGVAVFRAEIQLPTGGAATGWGVRSAADYFSREQGPLGYITAAENQALSRALAALGFGTEYAYDFDPPVENQAIVLPETPDYDSAEEGIELPMTINLTAEPNGSYNLTGLTPPSEEDAEDEDEEDEEDEDEDFAPKGEIRVLNERRPNSAPAPAPTPAPRPATPVAEATPVIEPPAPRERPVVAPRPAAPAPAPAPGTASQAVEDRLKNVRDDALRISIKQIYYEARQRFGYDEERVDNRSREIYKKPTFELDAEEADNYFERILAAKRRPGQ